MLVLQFNHGAFGPRGSDQSQSHRLCDFDHSVGTEMQIHFFTILSFIEIKALPEDRSLPGLCDSQVVMQQCEVGGHVTHVQQQGQRVGG